MTENNIKSAAGEILLDLPKINGSPPWGIKNAVTQICYCGIFNRENLITERERAFFYCLAPIVLFLVEEELQALKSIYENVCTKYEMQTSFYSKK